MTAAELHARQVGLAYQEAAEQHDQMRLAEDKAWKEWLREASRNGVLAAAGARGDWMLWAGLRRDTAATLETRADDLAQALAAVEAERREAGERARKALEDAPE
jgi:hypothetical protein